MAKKHVLTATAVAGRIIVAACSCSRGHLRRGQHVQRWGAGQLRIGARERGIRAALKTVKAAETFPTTIPVTDPLPSKAPAGKTVVFLQCEQEQCPLEGNGDRGRNQGDRVADQDPQRQASDPSTVVAALKTALQDKPVAVFFADVPQAVWEAAGRSPTPCAMSKAPTSPTTRSDLAVNRSESAPLPC